MSDELIDQMQRRIEALHANAESCLRDNVRMKAQVISLQAQADSWRAKAARKYAEAPEVGDLRQFYRAIEDLLDGLTEAAELYGVHKRINEQLQRIEDFVEGYEHYGSDGP